MLLISSQQTAYVANKRIVKSSRLIYYLLEVAENWKTKGILVTRDSKKAFNSLDLSFLLTILEKFTFGTNFIDWVKKFLNDQQLYVINRGATTKYFLKKVRSKVTQYQLICLYNA